jgi:hypothetical protein
MGARKPRLSDMPLVSVVMPCLNQVQFLEIAVRSVLEQDYQNTELIVADGLSTDGSVALLIELQREYGDRLQWTSQRDAGAAQAINKALAIASGDIIGWLNSDDMYMQGAVTRAVEFFHSRTSHQLVYGFANHIDANGVVTGSYATRAPSTPLDAFDAGSFICQPTVFMRKSALDQVGTLDESIQTAFDFDLWLRFFKRFPGQIGMIRRIQACSRLHAACMTQRLRRQVALDGLRVTAAHLGRANVHWVWTHIDEICAQYPMGGAEGSLIKQLEAFLIEAKPYLDAPTLKKVVEQVKKDYRFALSREGLFATVQPDGWVNKRVQVKYRWKDKPAAAVTMRCNAAWPKEAKLKLKVATPDGKVQTSTVEAPSEFILRFEVPPTEGDGYMAWTVETSQTFVPAKHNQASDDKRPLSFVVQALDLEVSS